VAKHRIAAIGGDGIGREVIAAGLEVLEALCARVPGLELEVESFDWGSALYRRSGEMMPAILGHNPGHFVAGNYPSH
jgi:tartrate dehydrogenase/decarboxylase/D-malate dehydrogenase